MKGKQRLGLLLVTMLVGAVMVGINVPSISAVLPPAAGTLDLFDVHDWDHNASALVSHETDTMPLWKNFDVKLMITNVSQYYSTVFSLAWNPSELDLISITAGDATFNASKTMFGPAYAEWNHTTGILREWAYGQLGADAGSVKAYADPTWGWVATLRFKWVGLTPPSIPSPISTWITITYIENGHKTGWYHLVNGRTPFLTLGQCQFYYWAKLMARRRPTASFYVSAPPSPPYYENEFVTFDASASTGGCDGDTDPTPITELHWDLGDGVTEVYIQGVNFTWTPTHNYTAAGDLTAKLYVVAPAVGWYSPDYQNTSTTFSLPIKISKKAMIFIDLYTESLRWPEQLSPYYTTIFIGTGPGVDADAYSPQENVTLRALAWWNDDAVQNKLVMFKIEGPTNPIENITLYRTGITNATGIANCTFRIPWPCTNAETIIFGTWTVTARVSLAEKELEDVLHFLVGWTVEITSVVTVDGLGAPKTTFKKGECVGVIITVTNIAMEVRYALITVVVYDDAGAVIGSHRYGAWVPPGGDTYQTEFWCVLEVPKWAYTGPSGMVYVNAYTPRLPWCPEVSAGPITITV